MITKILRLEFSRFDSLRRIPIKGNFVPDPIVHKVSHKALFAKTFYEWLP